MAACSAAPGARELDIGAFGLVRTLVERCRRGVVRIDRTVSAPLGLADCVSILAEGDLQFEGEPSDLTDRDELVRLHLGL